MAYDPTACKVGDLRHFIRKGMLYVSVCVLNKNWDSFVI